LKHAKHFKRAGALHPAQGVLPQTGALRLDSKGALFPPEDTPRCQTGGIGAAFAYKSLLDHTEVAPPAHKPKRKTTTEL